MTRSLISAFGDLLAPQAERDVVGHGQVREQRVRLEHGVDVALVRRHADDVAAGQHDPARVGLLEAGDHAQRGRLAAPRRAEQREELAPPDLDRHVVDRDHRRRSAWSRRRGRPRPASLRPTNGLQRPFDPILDGFIPRKQAKYGGFGSDLVVELTLGRGRRRRHAERAPEECSRALRARPFRPAAVAASRDVTGSLVVVRLEQLAGGAHRGLEFGDSLVWHVRIIRHAEQQHSSANRAGAGRSVRRIGNDCVHGGSDAVSALMPPSDTPSTPMAPGFASGNAPATSSSVA